jgi:hypothetical protein
LHHYFSVALKHCFPKALGAHPLGAEALTREALAFEFSGRCEICRNNISLNHYIITSLYHYIIASLHHFKLTEELFIDLVYPDPAVIFCLEITDDGFIAAKKRSDLQIDVTNFLHLDPLIMRGAVLFLFNNF